MCRSCFIAVLYNPTEAKSRGRISSAHRRSGAAKVYLALLLFCSSCLCLSFSALTQLHTLLAHLHQPRRFSPFTPSASPTPPLARHVGFQHQRSPRSCNPGSPWRSSRFLPGKLASSLLLRSDLAAERRALVDSSSLISPTSLVLLGDRRTPMATLLAILPLLLLAKCRTTSSDRCSATSTPPTTLPPKSRGSATRLSFPRRSTRLPTEEEKEESSLIPLLLCGRDSIPPTSGESQL